MKFDIKLDQFIDERSRLLSRVVLSYYWLSVPFWYHFNNPIILPLFIPLMVLFAFYTFWGRFTFTFLFMMGLVSHYFFQQDGISYVYLLVFLLNNKYSADVVLDKNHWSPAKIPPYLLNIGRALLMAGLGVGVGHFLLTMIYSPSDFEHSFLYPFMFLLMPKRLWNWLKDQLFPSQGQIKIYYDEKCQFCYKGVRLLKAFFLHETVMLRPCQSDQKIHQLMLQENSWVIANSVGELFTAHQAILVMLADSPLLFWTVPFFEIGYIQNKMEKFYRWLSYNRGTGSYWLNLLLEFNFKRK